MHIIIGGRGQLGKCLTKMSNNPVHHLDRTIYSEWWHKDSKKKILQYLKDKSITQGTIIIAAGILDPTRSSSEHECVNYLLPKHIIEAIDIPGFRVITFGTVMENLIGGKTQNPYILSKLRLGNFIQEYASNMSPALHIRLHTLYGGESPPHAFMFLGQLLHAINTESDFKMTNGEQLREYHHVEDATRAIFHFAESSLTGVTQLNHGKPEKLKDIASHVLRHFKYLSLLRLNALAPPTHENYEAFFEPCAQVKNVTFRKTLTGIVDYFEPFVTKSRIASSIAS